MLPKQRLARAKQITEYGMDGLCLGFKGITSQGSILTPLATQPHLSLNLSLLR